MATILITGSEGLCGKNLFKYFKSKGHRVIGVDKKTQKHSSGIKRNLTTPLDLKLFPKKVDFLIHLAADIDQQDAQPSKTLQNNVLAIFNVLEYTRNTNIKRFIYASSAGIYGKTSTAASEGSSPHPDSVYALSKYLGELITGYFSSKYGLKSTIVRLGYILGPGIPRRYFISKLISLLKNNRQITLINANQNIFSFIDVNDIARFCEKAFNGPTGTYNLTGQPASVGQVLKILLSYFPDYRDKIVYRKAKQATKYVFSDSKIKRVYTFKYQTSLSDSFQNILAFRSQKI